MVFLIHVGAKLECRSELYKYFRKPNDIAGVSAETCCLVVNYCSDPRLVEVALHAGGVTGAFGCIGVTSSCHLACCSRL